ncbi:spore germination protein [Fictibacillus sp. BK138]|uniref:spore germination protein n=1 Tax=Fictibacillus sp. BK138 TaxID=2512121 RepID=UPI00102A7DDD|nr:spore germination protein [Fictibacillus sp. BK138]RZT23742.1 spore germination protein KA [Fictibacillus sp. BK138]
MVFKKRALKKLLKDKNEADAHPQHENPKNEVPPEDVLSTELDQNVQYIRQTFGNSSDLSFSDFELGHKKAVLVYLNGLVDKMIISHFFENISRPEFLIEHSEFLTEKVEASDFMKQFFAPANKVNEIQLYKEVVTAILAGNAVLLVDSISHALVINAKGWRDRDVSESATENVVRGPKEAFTENIQTNTALVRRKIKDPRLWLEKKEIGNITQTSVSVMYIHSIANDKIVKEVHERLDKIDIDGILESNYIEEFIQDEVYTPFPTVFNTERPDVVAAALLEGRIAIFIDGTPFVLLVPALFTHFFQAAEDYYQRWDISTLLRLLRVTAYFISLLGPSAYIAVINFHQEMLPTPLLISLAAQREGVPFPALIEALIMEVTLEILREAGLRLPKAIGQTVSIVGALVIGQAAVEAGIISAAMVIVVSITAISNFILPAYNMGIAVRILRFLFMFLAGSFGLYGIAAGIFALALHLCSLRSFGIPYMEPLAPYIASDMKDTLWRKPRWKLVTRPRLINQTNIVRENVTPKNK